jgi:serine/threonine-protein kinase HipA
MFNVEVLNIFLSSRPIGKLFRFDNGTASPIIRFVADDAFAQDPNQSTVSVSMRSSDPAQQLAFWKDITANPFNGADGRLPSFFQNLLSEGVFRDHLAHERGCRPDDHFAMFAACGLDLPGAIKALPSQNLPRSELQRLITQNNDALEMSMTADPLPLGVSISGMQPKVGLIHEAGRYIARKRLGVTRIIGKLPQADRPLLPEVEHLSLTLASSAGANVCEHRLVALEKLNFDHGYSLGQSNNFLAVTRFDREGSKRIHCEDFAQALGVDPNHKYTGATYAAMAALMMRYPESMGLNAVHELLRLLTINDLIGNYDAHLKNFCLIYRDGITPELSKAFDIVAWSVYFAGQGNGLAYYRDAIHPPGKFMSPGLLRQFCNRVGVAEAPCSSVIKETVARARETWPDLVATSSISDAQKDKLLHRLNAHPMFSRTKIIRTS